MTRIELATVSSEPIDEAAVVAAVADARGGATVTFSGVVRNHDHGRAVTSIEYVGHPSAADVVARVSHEFAEADGVHALAVVHRVGHLEVGDVALSLAVTSSHRAEAFATASALVDRIKQELPVWKRQVFTDGTDEWSNCP
ncbi:molybdenum cofactor biosynthesis protein MoaE [Aestuariimicrobium ganziense]|uniref:molybdenum cofactor biosynthesis protein MoaE n=1 Tax=Aestuariimicrobium ganziense TaxID=2773677 RepID=UPI002E2BB372|nr:molybdenum cofactor biosynthesis protein MoaE [Aestuariimicrobium ganziense]